MEWKNLKKVKEKIWFPESMEYEIFIISDKEKKLERKIKFEVEDVVIGGKIENSLFAIESLNLPPSTEVIDRINHKRYRLGDR